MSDPQEFRESVTKVHALVGPQEYVMSVTYVDGLRDDMRDICKQRLILGFGKLAERKGWNPVPEVEFFDGPRHAQTRLKKLDGSPADPDVLPQWYYDKEVPEGHEVIDTGKTLCFLYGKVTYP